MFIQRVLSNVVLKLMTVFRKKTDIRNRVTKACKLFKRHIDTNLNGDKFVQQQVYNAIKYIKSILSSLILPVCLQRI